MKERKGQILIVDDSAAIVNYIKEALENRYELQVAHSGEEALEILKNFQPDLILLDVIMGGMDGYSVCERIRSQKNLGFVKVIMVSGETKLKERLRGYDAGVDDYIAKPFEQEELKAKVKVFMRLKAVEDELHRMNETLNEQVKTRTEQLIDVAQMAAIGKNTAGIVHNLKNPLQALMGYSELLELEHPGEKNILSLRKAANQMQEMIAAILVASHNTNRQDVQAIDMNKVLRDQLELFNANRFFKREITKELNLDPLPLYRGVYSHFSQIFANLLQNAVDAMFETEKKMLRIRSRHDDRAIQIEIGDTGNGIPEENLEKLFNPFYTTKPLSAPANHPTGTGLGLASCKEMVASYGGTITLVSEVGQGTTFTIRFPLHQ